MSGKPSGRRGPVRKGSPAQMQESEEAAVEYSRTNDGQVYGSGDEKKGKNLRASGETEERGLVAAWMWSSQERERETSLPPLKKGQALNINHKKAMVRPQTPISGQPLHFHNLVGLQFTSAKAKLGLASWLRAARNCIV